jgi:hypothetical protein
MAERKKAAKPTPPEVLKIHSGEHGITEGMTQSQIYAALSARSYLTAHVLRDYSGVEKGVIQTIDMAKELVLAGNEVVGGDLGRIERTLTSQFLTLDAIFANLAERSKRQEYMKQMETYLRLALKAQAQARATAEALALLKNPQPYIKQANIAQGHQQVNNMYASASAHSDKTTLPDKQPLENNPSPSFSAQYAQAHTGAGNSQCAPNKVLATVTA